MARSANSNKGVLPKRQMNNSDSKLDPATLLARGFTARFTGFVSGSMLEKSHRKTSLLQPLNNEEIQKDLRHMTAYETASQRYHQHHYVQLNRIPTNRASGYNVGAPLPVRLDPDHDKRLAAQRKQMARAEVLREALEQEYVAIRAHYVETCQDVQQLANMQRERLIFLQGLAQERAEQVAYARTRLQMARDIKGALQRRQQVLLENGVQEETQVDSNPSNHPLMDAWMELEQAGKNIGAKSSSLGNKAKVMPWKSLTVPSTPMGVPLLLSAASVIPEKSVAWLLDDSKMKDSVWAGKPMGSKGGQALENENNLVWLQNHLPLTVPDEQQDEDKEDARTDADVALSDVSKLDGDENLDEAQVVRELRRDVEWLEKELVLEGKRNAEILSATVQFRHRLDESTTMMALVRQETEAVLYRHNVLLADPDVVQKVEAMADAAEEAASNRSISPMAPPSIDEGEAPQVPPPPQSEQDDGANFGDDEGDGESMPNSKRQNAEADSPRKRRRI